MKESDLWKKIRDGTKSLGIHWSRIESWAGPGVPDLNGCYKGHEFWIELKVRRSKTIVFRPHQIAWHHNRSKAGGSSFIVIGDPRSGTVDLYTGSVIRRLLENEDVEPLWSSVIRRCDWGSMISAILDHRSKTNDPKILDPESGSNNLDNKDQKELA